MLLIDSILNDIGFTCSNKVKPASMYLSRFLHDHLPSKSSVVLTISGAEYIALFSQLCDVIIIMNLGRVVGFVQSALWHHPHLATDMICSQKRFFFGLYRLLFIQQSISRHVGRDGTCTSSKLCFHTKHINVHDHHFNKHVQSRKD